MEELDEAIFLQPSQLWDTFTQPADLVRQLLYYFNEMHEKENSVNCDTLKLLFREITPENLRQF